MKFRRFYTILQGVLVSFTLFYNLFDQSYSWQEQPSDNLMSKIRLDVIDKIVAKKNGLNFDKKFDFFELYLTDEEHECLESLQIKTAAPFRMYGNPEGEELKIALYLESLGNCAQHSAQAAAIIYRFITECFYASGAPAISVIIRPTELTNKFDVPRWHIDGLHDPILQGMNMKIVSALKGPGTLFSIITGSARDEFLEALYKKRDEIDADLKQRTLDKSTLLQMNYNRSFDLESRKEIAQLISSDKILQGATRQAALFIVGNSSFAAVHSEPAIDEDRLFIAIIPGSIEQIKYLQYVETGL